MTRSTNPLIIIISIINDVKLCVFNHCTDMPCIRHYLLEIQYRCYYLCKREVCGYECSYYALFCADIPLVTSTAQKDTETVQVTPLSRTLASSP